MYGSMFGLPAANEAADIQTCCEPKTNTQTKEDESCVPECITSKYIIKVVSSRDLIISKMDAFVEDPCEVQMLQKMMPLHSYCFDTEHVFELTAPSLPFL